MKLFEKTKYFDKILMPSGTLFTFKVHVLIIKDLIEILKILHHLLLGKQISAFNFYTFKIYVSAQTWIALAFVLVTVASFFDSDTKTHNKGKGVGALLVTHTAPSEICSLHLTHP